nr:glycine/betaine ABC transporter substrate-binding protein [Geodermatophilaceae bacterium]
NLYIAQNIVPILSESVSNDTIETALNAVSAALTTENLTAALAQVTVDKMSSADVAEQFLTDNGLI